MGYSNQESGSSSSLRLEDIAKRNNLEIADICRAVTNSRKAMRRVSRRFKVVEEGRTRTVEVTRTGFGILDTHFGVFSQFEFQVHDEWNRYSVLFAGNIDEEFRPIFGKAALLLRIDSGCEPSQITGNRTCECKEQLELSMEEIQKNGEGLIIRIPNQEGKGLGINHKLATYLLQRRLSISNIEAASLLSKNGTIDTRTYSGAIAVMLFMGVQQSIKIRLLTNDPRRLKVFLDNGFMVERVPLRIPPNEYTIRHLKAKQAYSGHIGLVANNS